MARRTEREIRLLNKTVHALKEGDRDRTVDLLDQYGKMIA